MAYVVARPRGRFEVRESLHTPKGPRARSLAGFEILTDGALQMAARRATRPFDAEAVVVSAKRAGAPVTAVTEAAQAVDGSSERFVEASRRMALSMREKVDSSKPADPGATLLDLLGFTDQVTRSQPARPFEPLVFPVIGRLVKDRRAASSLPRAAKSLPST